MPDGRLAVLLAESMTPCVWVVAFQDATSTRLTEAFILNELNNPTVKED